MSVFLIERNFAEQLQVDAQGAAKVNAINADIGVQWLISFLSADKKKTYCLYEAPLLDRSCRPGRSPGRRDHSGRRAAVRRYFGDG